MYPTEFALAQNARTGFSTRHILDYSTEGTAILHGPQKVHQELSFHIECTGILHRNHRIIDPQKAQKYSTEDAILHRKQPEASQNAPEYSEYNGIYTPQKAPEYTPQKVPQYFTECNRKLHRRRWNTADGTKIPHSKQQEAS